MYTAVTLSANVNAALKLRFAKVLFKIGTPVHFSRNKMMVSKQFLYYSTGIDQLYLPQDHLFRLITSIICAPSFLITHKRQIAVLPFSLKIRYKGRV